MLNYKFPEIYHIDDIRFAIADRHEFIIAEKPDMTVVNYVVAFADTFPEVTSDDDSVAIMRRELRGIKFDKQGNILARPYHKFHNLYERSETQLERINFGVPFHIMDKEDGSMIHPVRLQGGFRLCTKMGITDTSMEAEVVMAPKYRNFQKFFEYCEEIDHTPIFEFNSEENPIVVRYNVSHFVLTGMRHKHTGVYMPVNELIDLEKTFQDIFEVPMTLTLDSGFVNEFLSTAKDDIGIEGYVIRFDNGHMLKVKTPWYLARHKTKEFITREHNVVSAILNGEIDDVIATLNNVEDKENLKRLEQFSKKLRVFIDNTVTGFDIKFADLTSGLSRKEIALQVIPTFDKTKNPFDSSLIFKYLDGNSVYEGFVNIMKNAAGGVKSYEDFKKLYDDIPSLR